MRHAEVKAPRKAAPYAVAGLLAFCVLSFVAALKAQRIGYPQEEFAARRQKLLQAVRTETPSGLVLLFGSTLHHVGMYLGAGYMINAPNTGDYVKVQLVSDNGDFTVAVRP